MVKKKEEKKCLSVYSAEQAARFMSKYVPTAKSVLTNSLNEAKKYQKWGFPIVLKIVSQQALHKTEIEGVQIANSKEDFEYKYNLLLNNAKKHKLDLQGIYIQEFIKGEELIVGLNLDASFGHVIMFGLGGIFVDILKDLSFRVCPLTDKDAQSMIDEIKGKDIIYGTRGRKGVNIKLLKKILIAVSNIPKDNPNISELDINPLIINDKDGKVVDTRVVFNKCLLVDLNGQPTVKKK